MSNTKLRDLACIEPWRTGQGQAHNALDPTWEPVHQTLCQGSIAWEGSTKWWTCTACGHCGFWSNTTHHPTSSPYWSFIQGLQYFFRKREQQRTPVAISIRQALYVAGVVLRYAATKPPDQLGYYVQEHLVTK